MAIKTYTEQLEAVQTAIEAVEGGAQEYWVDGKKLVRGDLETLYRREKELRQCVAMEAGGFTTLARYGAE